MEPSRGAEAGDNPCFKILQWLCSGGGSSIMWFFCAEDFGLVSQLSSTMRWEQPECESPNRMRQTHLSVEVVHPIKACGCRYANLGESQSPWIHSSLSAVGLGHLPPVSAQQPHGDGAASIPLPCRPLGWTQPSTGGSARQGTRLSHATAEPKPAQSKPAGCIFHFFLSIAGCFSLFSIAPGFG